MKARVLLFVLLCPCGKSGNTNAVPKILATVYERQRSLEKIKMLFLADGYPGIVEFLTTLWEFEVTR